jgi:ATP-dependent Clp protease adaptor protein ClpS
LEPGKFLLKQPGNYLKEISMKKEELKKSSSARDRKDSFHLVLYNDDVNTFDHVIKSLVEVCGHDEYQAEQCAMLTHFKGKCEVKTGNRAVLESMANELKIKGLKSAIENN